MYFLRMIAWAFLFLALAGWGAECVYSLEVGAYQVLTPAILWQAISPQTVVADANTSSLLDGLNMVFMARPIWMMPAIVSTILFVGVRRRRKKWMFRNN
jgi:hypothetical protein